MINERAQPQSSALTAHGADAGAIGTKSQKERGINLNKAEIVKYLGQYAHDAIDKNLVKIWADRSGEVFDEVIDLLAPYGIVVGQGVGSRSGLDELEPFYRQYSTSHSFVHEGSSAMEELASGGSPTMNLISTLADIAEQNGAEFLFQTKAEQLLREGTGPVTGAVAKADDGSYIKVNAKNGVILATGDPGGNEEMVEAWCPFFGYWSEHDVPFYTPPGGNNGDDHRMGLWVGAAVQSSPAAPMIHAVSMRGPMMRSEIGYLMVNKFGQRFNNEEPNETTTSNSRFTQPNHDAWWIFDGGYPEKILSVYPTGLAA